LKILKIIYFIFIAIPLCLLVLTIAACGIQFKNTTFIEIKTNQKDIKKIDTLKHK